MENMKTILIAGGNGFLGKHLVKKLLLNYKVIVLDNYLTSKSGELGPHENLTILDFDIIQPITLKGEIKAIYHMASPASPVDYFRFPLETMLANSSGTLNLLNLAKEKNAKFIFLSTSEVYGDPQVSPQGEGYFGNVNPIGPRAVYDEAKRYGEALTNLYHNKYEVDTLIYRIFNTYGPGMRLDDGRAVPAFVNALLANSDLPVQGNGEQLRSFCYVEDTVEALVKGLDCTYPGPINVGSDNEISILKLSQVIRELALSDNKNCFTPAREEDPTNRCPELTKARKYLSWRPSTSLEEGLRKTLLSYGFELNA